VVMVEVRVQSGCGEIREMELAMVAVRINEEMSSRSDRCMRMAMVIQMHRGLKDQQSLESLSPLPTPAPCSMCRMVRERRCQMTCRDAFQGSGWRSMGSMARAAEIEQQAVAIPSLMKTCSGQILMMRLIAA